MESEFRLSFLAIIRNIMEEFNCDFNAPMYVDFENLDGDGNADEFFDNRIEDEGGSSNQLALPVEKFGVAAEEEQPPALPPRTTSIQRSAASGFSRKSPLKANTGSSGSVRKSPLKTWNRQAGTPNNTGIDHLRPNTSSGSSLETINKSGSSRKPLHLTKDQAAQMVQRLVPSQSSLAIKTKFVSLAEETRKYYGTPDRFRRAKFRSSSAGAHPRQRSPSPGQSAVSKLTNPETPRLLTRGRVRPTNNEEEKPKIPSAEDRLASLRKRLNIAPPLIKQTSTSKAREEKAKNSGNPPMKQPLRALHNGIPIILHNKQIYNNSKVPSVGPEVNKKPLPPVSADSVHYKLYQKDKEIRAKLESNREKEMERERQLAQGVKAREPKVLSKKPFLPSSSDREPVRPLDLHLRTDLRSEERRQYEQRRKDKEAEMEGARQQEMERRERQEQLELQKQRNATITKAQPIRHFAPIEIVPSNMPLTAPKTPNFRTRVRHKSTS